MPEVHANKSRAAAAAAAAAEQRDAPATALTNKAPFQRADTLRTERTAGGASRASSLGQFVPGDAMDLIYLEQIANGELEIKYTIK